MTGESTGKIAHVLFAVVSALFLIGLALAARKTLSRGDGGIIPDTKLTPLTFFELLITDGVFGMLESLMGREGEGLLPVGCRSLFVHSRI